MSMRMTSETAQKMGLVKLTTKNGTAVWETKDGMYRIVPRILPNCLSESFEVWRSVKWAYEGRFVQAYSFAIASVEDAMEIIERDIRKQGERTTTTKEVRHD